MKDIRLIVTGGRYYKDAPHIHFTLNRLHAHLGIAELFEGAGGNTDKAAWFWRMAHKIPGQRFPANWEAPCLPTCRPNHRRYPGNNQHSYCPAAGIYRNHRMYDTVLPTLVAAFPGGNGTADMTDYSLSNGTPVLKMLHTRTRELPHEVLTPLGTDAPDFSWL